MTHVMIDIETLSTRPDAAIISIGAVVFSADGRKTPPAERQRFSATVTARSNARLGRHIDPDTVMWWISQGAEARAALAGARVDLAGALTALATWLDGLGPSRDLYVWGNGATFDPVILHSAYQAADMATPWRYANVRCLRTLKALLPQITSPEAPTVAHNALADAVAQAEHAESIFSALTTSLEMASRVEEAARC